MPIKILNLINSLNDGGAQAVLKNFVLEAKKYNEFNIEICTLYPLCTRYYIGIFKKEIERTDIPIWNIGLNFKYNPVGVIKLISLIKKRKYDVVHVHLFPASAFVAVASLFLSRNIKFVFTEHSVHNRRRSLSIFKLFDILIYNRYSSIVCISSKIKDVLLKWLPQLGKKVTIIPNSVPISESIDTDHPKIYDILFIGRFKKIKGIDILFKAVNILKFQYQKKIKVAIVGNGPLKEELKELVEKLQIKSEIKFLGTRKDVSRIMFSSKILTLSSEWEGLPMVILEAMSRGLPVIATAVGGIPDVIKDGEEGILVAPKDPEILAEAMARLLEDEKLQKTLSQNAYKKIKERYTVEMCAKDVLSLYKSLTKNY